MHFVISSRQWRTQRFRVSGLATSTWKCTGTRKLNGPNGLKNKRTPNLTSVVLFQADGNLGTKPAGRKPGQEDVKKLISFSFRDFIFDPKCLPTAQRSLIGHSRAICFKAESTANFKIDFFTSS